MIGRKQRKRVVYVDGIPIESALLDAGDSGLKDTEKSDPAALAALDPRVLFDKYDTDGSGDIDLEEFKVLLRDLGVELTEPKARAYFKRCDRRRRGCISFDEFRLALYTCDPKHPDRTGGFAPGQSLAPKDLFEMFDRDEEGAIDRGTFMELLEFIGHKMPLDKMEALFSTYEDPELEMLGYFQFKKAWLTIVDVRAELRARGERFNKFLPSHVLAKKLAAVVALEEKQEARTLLEANHTLSDEAVAAQRRELVSEAHVLARVALAEALDAAGQVYVFGKGAFQRFDSEPREPDFVEFMEYRRVRELWGERVCPPPGTVSSAVAPSPPVSSSAGNEEGIVQSTDGSESPLTVQSPVEMESQKKGKRPSPSRTTLDTAARAFAGRQVSKATAFLWGKRVTHVACGAAVAYALTDAGEVFCWGGNKRQWRYFYDDATYVDPNNGSNGVPKPESVVKGGLKGAVAPQTDSSTMAPSETNQQQDAAMLQRPLTTRSEMLKLFALPSQVAESRESHAQLGLRQKYGKVFEKPEPVVPTDEDKRKRLQVVGEYYDLLDPFVSPLPPQASGETAQPTATSPTTTRPPPSLQELLETVEPELNVDELSLSLFLRGIELPKPTRMVLLETLGECLELEIECVGAPFHAHMRQQDQLARRYLQEKREKQLASLAFRTAALWYELRALRNNMAAAEHERLTKGVDEYEDMKRKISHATQKLKRRAREGHGAPGLDVTSSPKKSDNNLQEHDSKSLLYANGLTSRGPELRFFDGAQALQTLAVGSRHALAIHASGKLYTWGVGSFGRLGGAQMSSQTPKALKGTSASQYDDSESRSDALPIADWHRDAYSAQVVSTLSHVRFRAVACGFSHSLALSTDGRVYVWGSATHGKLGVGVVHAAESFSLVPMELRSLPATVRVRRIACGPSHSALLTVDGALFVWGCGAGGKLGLGDGRNVGQDRVPRHGGQLRVLPTPTRVLEPFTHEHLVEVSCGAAHTAVLSAIERRSDGSAGGGGRVFVAGSSHALGQFTPQFSVVNIPSEAGDAGGAVKMARVSCGPGHTALVSCDGELYTWGKNVGGSTGHAVSLPLVTRPTRVECLYARPRNLCLDATAEASQSSQNASCMADFALGGQRVAQELARRRQRRTSDSDRCSTAANYAQTQQEVCPFWQVALSSRCRIVTVRLTLVTPSGDALGGENSTTRALKHVILVSEDAFDPDLRGKQALAKARAQSVHVSLSSDARGKCSWTAPADTFGRFVRIQLENSAGVAMLGLTHVEVLGASASAYVGPRVADVVCAEALTVAICAPLADRAALREKFQRAVRSDPASIDILAQLESFHAFVREGEREVREEAVLRAASCGGKGSASDKRAAAVALAALEAKQRATLCVLCRPSLRCVVCEMEQQVRAGKQRLAEPVALNVEQKSGNKAKPGDKSGVRNDQESALEMEPARTLEALSTELLMLGTRSKAEEEAAQRQLELELADVDTLARVKREEDAKQAAATASQEIVALVASEKLKARGLFMRFLALARRQRKKTLPSH